MSSTAPDQTAERGYYDQIKSLEWKRLRRLILQRDNYKCRACLVRPAEEVHHVTYRLGFFAPAFLLVSLCSRCHRDLHSIWFGADTHLPPANDNGQMELILGEAVESAD